MAKVTNWDKFVLLLWKNWTLQWNHKWQMVIELVLPAIFSLLLVLVRTLVDTEQMDTKLYTSQNITDLSLLKHSLHSSSYLGKLLALIAPNRRRSTLSVSNFQYAVYYSPTNPVLEKLVTEAWTSLQMSENTIYASTNAAQLQTDVVGKNAFAGIQFDDAWANVTNIAQLPQDFHFALRFPSELRTATIAIANTWLTMRLFPTIDLTGPRNEKDEDGGIPPGYLREGFLPLQHQLSMAYIRQRSGEQELPEVVMQRYPYPAYIYDPLLEGMSSIMSLIILLSFIYPCTYITKYITAEKEKQLKEVMKIMGLSNWLHWTAWFVKSFIMLTISAILIAILVKINWSEDVAVLTHANFTALVFFLIIYIIASICFCFMMATFFSRASTAAAVTGLIWFIAYIPYSFTINTYDDLSLTSKLGWSLISNTGMGFGIKLILGFEGTGEGLQWSNFFTPVSVDDTLTLGAVMIMMLVSCFICMTICLYVEQVMPGSFGVPRPWHFPFSREFWCGEREYTGVEDIPNGGPTREQRDPKAFEAEPEGKHIGLQMRNLKKRFVADKMVVKGLSMNMFEDEITVLLGHNGAGKTTTISMLTGMFPPTSGTAIINGSDIRTNIEGARMSLGICPQHNVLFDEMSVSNHIRFFSRMKGLKGKAVEQEVAKYLKMIELEDKANVASSKLSGGMKRKLSVCCALCGDTKVVLCDEPSSGMDPSARRQLWDLLQQEKIGRTLLLTTHFMDEADVLGDRIAIMCDGELKCHGTSFFLKKQYGSGYRLICVKRDDCQTNEVTALLNKFIPGIKPECDIGAELSYQLPDSASDKFEEMFGQLEDQSDELHLNGYGVGITSMEEVFMKVGAEKDISGNVKDPSEIMNGGTGYHPSGEDNDNESVQSDGIFSENRRLLQGLQLLSNQWKAMLLKKFLYTWRNKLLLLIQNIMPVFFVVVTILIIETQGTFQELKPITMSLTQYPLAVTVLDRSSATNSISSAYANQYEALAKSHGSDYALEVTGTASFTDYILELGKTIQVRINSRYLVAASIAESRIIAWLNNQALHTAPLTVNMVHNALAKQLLGADAHIAVTNAPLPYTPNTLLSQLSTGNNLGTQLASNLCFCMCFVSSIYILFLIKERESRAKLLQFVGGVKVWTFWLSQFICDFATYIVTALIVVITIVCFQEAGLSTFPELGRYFLLLLLFGFSVLPFIYIMSLFFKEPATGFARVSIVNIFCGMALFIVVVVMSSDFFDTKDTADILGWIFRVFPHFSLAMGLNKVYTNTATRNACEKVSAIPPILLCELIPQCCNIKPYFAWEAPGVLPETLYMTVTGVVFFLIIIILEFRLIGELMFKIRQLLSKPPPPPPEGHLDDDVARERERILHMSSDELAAKNLVLDRVTKYYGQFLAVNQVSLCVQEVECFGLLGVNGAGKTTTFKMMTGDERITSGAAYVQGLSLESNMNSIYKMIGYCPQFDALLDDLTGREVLRIFCMLRGVQESRIKQLSEDLAKSFGFFKHIDKQTHAYSGGNKRKLSTAIAVIGSPSVIYLDEPTTGMDPAARRQLWNMVCRIRDSGKSIVLTSHSMEECEALCTRLAIMVNGEFKCIGSTQHLKNKFSKGLILKIKVRRNMEALRQARLSAGYARSPDEPTVPAQMEQQNIDAVKEFVEREYPNSILQEEYQGILTFYIPLTGVKWSRIFGLMESNRDQLNVEDYSVSQTTLEEIFLEFAKYQREDTRANQ
ncbi:hypothetical protein KR059_012458 [Drosophila kikkawai]|nr:hypothetical protein KR059_012458 [Drosophila kikkawai]